MTRNDAVWALRHCDYLTANDKHVFNTLLMSADHPDCNLPDRFTPTRPELATWTGLSASSVKRSVNHLVSHGWLVCDTGRGNGRKSRYRLLPDAPDAECQCAKVSHRPLRAVPKEVTGNPLAEGKGVTQNPLRSQGEPSKGSNDSPNPQVEPQNPRKDARKEGEEGTHNLRTPERACDYHPTAPGIRDTRDGSFRCRACGPHLWKEPAA